MIRNKNLLGISLLLLAADNAIGTGTAVMDAPTTTRKGDKSGEEKRAQKEAGQKAAESLIPFFTAGNTSHLLTRESVAKALKGRFSLRDNVSTLEATQQTADELAKLEQSLIDTYAAQVKTICRAVVPLATKDYTLTGGLQAYQVVQNLLGIRVSKGQANNDTLRGITGVSVAAK